MIKVGPVEYDESTRVGADVITRYRYPRVGADWRDGKCTGKYGVYFYDRDENLIRSVGGFATPAEAARAIPFIIAEQILEDVAVWEADTYVDD